MNQTRNQEQSVSLSRVPNLQPLRKLECFTKGLEVMNDEQDEEKDGVLQKLESSCSRGNDSERN